MSPADFEKPNWDTDGEFLHSLQDALRPEPLPDELTDRIRADWDRRAVPGRVIRLRSWSWAAAAAACLMVLLWPSRQFDSSFAAVELTADDAALIVAAYGVLSWEDTVDYSIAMIDVSMNDIDQTLRVDGGVSGAAYFDDAWDLPISDNAGETGVRMPADAAAMPTV